MSGALLYFSKTIHEKHPKMTVKEKNLEAAKLWRAMTTDEKKAFEQESTCKWTCDPFRRECSNSCTFKEIKGIQPTEVPTIPLMSTVLNNGRKQDEIDVEKSLSLGRRVVASLLAQQATRIPNTVSHWVKSTSNEAIEEVNAKILRRKRALEEFADINGEEIVKVVFSETVLQRRKRLRAIVRRKTAYPSSKEREECVQTD